MLVWRDIATVCTLFPRLFSTAGSACCTPHPALHKLVCKRKCQLGGEGRASWLITFVIKKKKKDKRVYTERFEPYGKSSMIEGLDRFPLWYFCARASFVCLFVFVFIYEGGLGIYLLSLPCCLFPPPPLPPLRSSSSASLIVFKVRDA